MSKFSQFDAPTGTKGPISVQKVTGKDFGGGGGLEVLGKDIKSFGEMLAVRQEDAAALFREETIADDRLFAATRMQELKDTLPNGGDGIFEILKEEMTARFETNRGLQTTNTAQGQYGVQSKRLMATFMAKAVGVQAGATALGIKNSFGKILDFNKNSVRAEPTDEMRDASIEQVERMINGSQATAKIRPEMLEDARRGLWAAQADGLLSPTQIKSADDAKRVLNRLNTEEFKKELGPKVFDQVLSRAETLVKQYTNQEDVTAAEDISKRLQEEATGVRAPDGTEVQDAEINEIKDPKRRDKLLAQAVNSRRAGRFNFKLSTADFAEVAEMRKQLVLDFAKKGNELFEVKQQKALKTRFAVLTVEASAADRKVVDQVTKHAADIAAGAPDDRLSDATIAKIHDPEIRKTAEKAKAKAIAIRDFNKQLKAAGFTGLAAMEQKFIADVAQPGDEVFEAKQRKLLDQKLAQLTAEATKVDRALVADVNQFANDIVAGATNSRLPMELIEGITNPRTRADALAIREQAIITRDFKKELAGADLAELAALQRNLSAEQAEVGDEVFEEKRQRALDARLTQLTAEATTVDRTLLERVTTGTKAIAAGGANDLVPVELIEGITNVDAREAARQALDIAKSVRDVKEFVGFGRTSQVTQEGGLLRGVYQAALASGDADAVVAAATELKAFDEAMKVREDRIDTDPAKYAAETHQSVWSAIKNYTNNSTPENFMVMAEAQIAAQTSTFGIDPRDVHVYPADLVSQFKDARSRVGTDPDAADKIYELIVVERERAGPLWPLVMKQFKQAGAFNGSEATAASMTRTDQLAAANDLIRASAMEREGLFKIISPTKRGDLEDALTIQFADLHGTLNRGVTGGEAAFQERFEAAKVLAMKYMRDGATPAKAAQTAASAVATSNYLFAPDYRVPVSEKLPLDVVESATQGFLAQYDFKDVLVPRGNGLASAAANKAQYIDALQSQGYWATNGDETGLILMAPNQTVVDTKNGPVEMLWEEMRALPPPLPGTSSRPWRRAWHQPSVRVVSGARIVPGPGAAGP